VKSSNVHKRAWWSILIPGIIVLSGCQPVVNVNPAQFANTPECANMSVRLPETVAGLDRRSINAQATAAWGSPVAVIVRCGLPLPAPNPLPCATLDGIDWLIDEADAPSFRFLTYGLDPATEVIVDSEAVSGTEVLRDLGSAIGSQSAPVQACLDSAGGLN
jgi:hypothetical protein